MIEGQQSVIREIAGRRKRRREVNRKLRKETISLRKIMQTGSAGSVGGGGGRCLSEEKSDPKRPATLRVGETLCLSLEWAWRSWTLEATYKADRVWKD